jgi:hypothetical protein
MANRESVVLNLIVTATVRSLRVAMRISYVLFLLRLQT